MTDQTFILLLKAAFKRYYIPSENGCTESVGFEIENIVEQFRNKVIDDHEAGKETKVSKAFEDLKAAVILEFYQEKDSKRKLKNTFKKPLKPL